MRSLTDRPHHALRRGPAHGHEGWQLVPELVRDETERLVHEHDGDAFEATDLEAVLAEREVGRLVVTGAQTDARIRSTLHGALVRGYDATLVADAHTTEDQTSWGAPAPEAVLAHTNLSWSDESAPGRRGETVRTAEVDFAGARSGSGGGADAAAGPQV